MNDIEKELRRMIWNVSNELELAYEKDLESENDDMKNLREYLERILKYDYRVDYKKRPTSCRVWFALGRPNIWVNTETSSVYGKWDGYRNKVYLLPLVSNAIFKIMIQDWNNY